MKTRKYLFVLAILGMYTGVLFAADKTDLQPENLTTDNDSNFPEPNTVSEVNKPTPNEIRYRQQFLLGAIVTYMALEGQRSTWSKKKIPISIISGDSICGEDTLRI